MADLSKLGGSGPGIKLAGPITNYVDLQGSDYYVMSESVASGSPAGSVEFNINGKWLIGSIVTDVFITTVNFNVTGFKLEVDGNVKIDITGIISPPTGGTVQIKPIYGSYIRENTVFTNEAIAPIEVEENAKITIFHGSAGGTRSPAVRLRMIPIE